MKPNNSLKSNWDFILTSLKSLNSTGTITRSSSYLCKGMTGFIDFEKGKNIVELGAGDGVISRYILDELKEDSKLYIFEIHEEFVKQLRNEFKDDRVEIISDSAEFIREIMEARQIEQVDYILSAIPFVMLPEEFMKQTVQSCYDLLKPGGKFIQMHYSLLPRKTYMDIFGNLELKFVALNIPPAFIMVCEKKV
jgi:phospholipid N-methyltransferase